MAIPLKYNLGHLVQRWRTNVLTIIAIGVVVAVFISVLALANGLSNSFVQSGHPLNLLIMRSGATSETNSAVNRDHVRILRYVEGAEIAPDGEPMVSVEAINLSNIPKAGGGTSNAAIRGVGAKAMDLRPGIRIVEGRMFRPGVRELIVGNGAANRFARMKIGDTLRLSKSTYTIVGRFDANRAAFDSEIWGDVDELCREFDREQYSSMVIRARDPYTLEQIKKRIADDNQLASLAARTETSYYEEQTKNAGPIQFLGGFLAVVMSVGAVFSAMNTMYAAISSRAREIATLRIVGYGRRSILVSFMFESVLLSLAGGAVGGALSLLVNGIQTGTTNFYSFTEVTFAFRVTPGLIIGGLVFAGFMGLIGGFLPALQASRRPIMDALRGG